MAEADQPRVPVIGIGASAGGIQAFQSFFENMPADSGFAFIVMLHLPADKKSILPELISRWTAMPVREATDGCTLQANCVYVPPPGIVVTFRDGRLHHHLPTPTSRVKSTQSACFSARSPRSWKKTPSA